jgi:hypothetical protein
LLREGGATAAGTWLVNSSMPTISQTPVSIFCGRMQALSWKATTALEERLRLDYDWFLSNQSKLRQMVIEASTTN